MVISIVDKYESFMFYIFMINKILLKKHSSQFIMGGFFNPNEKNDSLIIPVFLTTF